MPGNDKSIPTVVARATENHNWFPLRVQPHQHLGRPAAGILHQHHAGDAVLLDRPAVQLADLGAGQGRHGDWPRSNFIPGVSTCSAIPVAAPRSSFLPGATVALRASTTTTWPTPITSNVEPVTTTAVASSMPKPTSFGRSSTAARRRLNRCRLTKC